MRPADLRMFIGRDDIYAVQGKGIYTPVMEPLTDEVLAKHLAGDTSVGAYTNVMDTCRFFMFDVDDGDRDMAVRLSAACRRRGFPTPSIEVSGGKGYHVWVLFDQLVPAERARRVAKSIAEELTFTGEVFPKQVQAKNLGSLVKLPYGKHAVTGNWSKFLGLEPKPHSVDRLNRAYGALPPEVLPTKDSWGPLPCLDSIQTQPPGEGERNICAFQFAAHLYRAGLRQEAVAAVMYDWNQRVSPPLPLRVIEQIIENASGGAILCNDLSPTRHCGDKCVKERGTKSLSTRPGQLRHAGEGELIVVQVGRRERNGIVSLKHPDASEAKAALKEK